MLQMQKTSSTEPHCATLVVEILHLFRKDNRPFHRLRRKHYSCRPRQHRFGEYRVATFQPMAQRKPRNPGCDAAKKSGLRELSAVHVHSDRQPNDRVPACVMGCRCDSSILTKIHMFMNQKPYTCAKQGIYVIFQIFLILSNLSTQSPNNPSARGVTQECDGAQPSPGGVEPRCITQFPSFPKGFYRTT